MGDERLRCACCQTVLPQDFVVGFICFQCGWQSDYVQDSMPDFEGGANDISLNEARENYRMTGRAILYINTCPVCGHRHKAEYFEFEICPKCGWEDDPSQVEEPDTLGANGNVSFNQALENYKKCGRALEEGE